MHHNNLGGEERKITKCLLVKCNIDIVIVTTVDKKYRKIN